MGNGRDDDGKEDNGVDGDDDETATQQTNDSDLGADGGDSDTNAGGSAAESHAGESVSDSNSDSETASEATLRLLMVSL